MRRGRCRMGREVQVGEGGARCVKIREQIMLGCDLGGRWAKMGVFRCSFGGSKLCLNLDGAPTFAANSVVWHPQQNMTWQTRVKNVACLLAACNFA